MDGVTSTVRAILEELDRSSRLPLTRAITGPPAMYTSPEFFDWEREHVFAAEWMCVAHVSQVPAAGDFLNLDLFDEPLTVVRGRDGAVRVLSRVCPHRGMDIMPPGFGYAGFLPADRLSGRKACGHAKVLLCPYHHWSFDLEGALKGCAEMHQAEGFATSNHRLRQFRSEVWEGFVFVNLNGEAQALSTALAPLREQVAPFDMQRLEVVIEESWECPFNWKVMIENWMESYHHLGAHHDTLQTFMPAKDTWTEEERPHFVRSHLPIKPSLVARAGLSPGQKSGLDAFEPIPGVGSGQRAEWAIHVGYPCFMFGVASDRVLWYRLEPVATNRCRLLTTVMVAPEATRSERFREELAEETEMLRGFHRQDMQVCSAVQRGLESSSYSRGPLSHLEMPVWLIQRYIAARGRGTWPTIDLAAAPSQRVT